MLYRVYVLHELNRVEVFASNSFSRAREAYLSALSSKSLKVNFDRALMTCAGRIINRHRLSDHIPPSDIRSN